MRISKAMREHLGWMIKVQDGPGHGTRIRMMVPTQYENLRTHEALVRRGAVSVDAEGYTEVTLAGREAAR